MPIFNENYISNYIHFYMMKSCGIFEKYSAWVYV